MKLLAGCVATFKNSAGLPIRCPSNASWVMLGRTGENPRAVCGKHANSLELQGWGRTELPEPKP